MPLPMYRPEALFPECLCIRPVQTLLARYFGYLLMEFDQTFIANGLWGKFWGQKVDGQGHTGVKYAPKCTFWPC